MSSTYDWAWYALAAMLAAVGIAVGAIALFRDRSHGRRRCPKCWYSMAGVPGTVCPECGCNAQKEKRLYLTRRRWGWVMCALVLVASSYLSSQVPSIQRRGWVVLVPSTLLIELASTDDLAVLPPGAKLPGSYWLQAEADTRLLLGRLWGWQSQRYVERMVAANRVDLTRVLLTPAWWVRDKAMPAELRAASALCQHVQVQTRPGYWSGKPVVEIEPPLAESMSIPVRMLVNGRPVYQTQAPLQLSLAADIEHLFEPRAGLEIDAEVAALLRPTLANLDGQWRIVAVNRNPAKHSPASGLTIAFRADLVLDGRVIGSVRGGLQPESLAWRHSSLLPITWVDGTAPEFNPRDITLRVSGDFPSAWALWSPNAVHAGPARPRAWTGRFECPAVREEESK